MVLTNEKLDKLFEELDKNRDERIQFDEFVEFLAHIKNKPQSPDDMLKLFETLAGGKKLIKEEQLRKSGIMKDEVVNDMLSKMKKVGSDYDYVSYIKEHFGQ